MGITKRKLNARDSYDAEEWVPSKQRRVTHDQYDFETRLEEMRIAMNDYRQKIAEMGQDLVELKKRAAHCDSQRLLMLVDAISIVNGVDKVFNAMDLRIKKSEARVDALYEQDRLSSPFKTLPGINEFDLPSPITPTSDHSFESDVLLSPCSELMSPVDGLAVFSD